MGKTSTTGLETFARNSGESPTFVAGKPSLVCDFQELYRYLIDDFLIDRCQKLHKNDFVFVTDFMMRLRMRKKIHQYLLGLDDFKKLGTSIS